MNKPKAYIDKRTSAMEQLQIMLATNPELYNHCISTLGFAYGFSQLANRAIHFDFLFANGLIPSDYCDDMSGVKEGLE